ncbi:MAG: hypothetical protein WCG86_07090 [Actinomycetota bacterium]|jgi:hypothetical protein
MKRIVIVATLGLVLSGCGQQTAAQATSQWMSQSSYQSGHSRLVTDARNAAAGLARVSSTSAELHTLCGVLLVDALAANASLPSPDAQATSLLAHGYQRLGDGAHQCYSAGSTTAARAKATASLADGVGYLLSATIRLGVASSP